MRLQEKCSFCCIPFRRADSTSSQNLTPLRGFRIWGGGCIFRMRFSIYCVNSQCSLITHSVKPLAFAILLSHAAIEIRETSKKIVFSRSLMSSHISCLKQRVFSTKVQRPTRIFETPAFWDFFNAILGIRTIGSFFTTQQKSVPNYWWPRNNADWRGRTPQRCAKVASRGRAPALNACQRKSLGGHLLWPHPLARHSRVLLMDITLPPKCQATSKALILQRLVFSTFSWQLGIPKSVIALLLDPFRSVIRGP